MIAPSKIKWIITIEKGDTRAQNEGATKTRAPFLLFVALTGVVLSSSYRPECYGSHYQVRLTD